MNSNSWTFLFILIFFLSCSHLKQNQTVKEAEASEIYVTVDENQHTPVEIKSGIGRAYGPLPQLEQEDRELKKEDKWAIILGPGLRGPICYAGLFRAFDHSGLELYAYGGFGMGAMVAAMLAKGMTDSEVEWWFYKLDQKSQQLDSWSAPWIQTFEDQLNKTFKGKSIQSLKKVYFLFNKGEDDNWSLELKGNLLPLLREELGLEVNAARSEFKSDANFSSNDVNNYFKHRLGITKILSVDLGDSEQRIKIKNEYLIGHVGNLLGAFDRISKNSNLIMKINIPYDQNVDNSSQIVNSCYNEGLAIAKKMKNFSEIGN